MSLDLSQAVMVMGYEWLIAREEELPMNTLQTNETPRRPKESSKIS